MKNHNDCRTAREDIAALIMGELDPASAERLNEHIETCASCRSFREALAGQEEELRSTFDAVARSVGRVEQFVERFDERSDKSEPQAFSTSRRFTGGFRVMLRSKKMLAAAAVIVAMFGGLASWLIPGKHVPGQPTPGVVWGDVVKQLRTSRPYSSTYTYEFEGKPPLTYREMRLSPSRRREHRADGTIYVIDLSGRPNRVLTLRPDKTAVEEALVNEGPRSDPDLLGIVAGMADGTAEDLGIQQVDGRPAHGFHRPDARNEFTVWADPQTGLPIRVELSQPQIARKIIVNDFDFDTPLDESLFDTTAPEGYTVTKKEDPMQASGITPGEMAKRATFKTYVFSIDPAWTRPMQFIEATDPASPGHWMYVAAAIGNDGRHVVLAQSQTFNSALPEKIKQGRLVYTSPNGFKVWRGGKEKWFSQILLQSAGDIIQDAPSEERTGYALESPSGTIPLLAINGVTSDEELHAVVDSLVPAEEYQEPSPGK